MIICLCEGISDRDITAAARQGVRTVRELSKVSDAGSGCGSCRRDLRKLLDAHSPSETATTRAHTRDGCASDTTAG